MNYTQLEEDLISDYGIWLRARQTNNGHFVIGVGNKADVSTKEISLERAGFLLSNRIAKSLSNVSTIFSIQFFDSLHESIQRVLLAIEYEDGLKDMPEFVESVRNKDWESALTNFLQTDFAKIHPRRASRISGILSQGDTLWQ